MQQPVPYHHDPKRVRDRPHPPRAPKRERHEARQHNHGQHESREPNAKGKGGQGKKRETRSNGSHGGVVHGEKVGQRFIRDMNRERDAENGPSESEVGIGGRQQQRTPLPFASKNCATYSRSPSVGAWPAARQCSRYAS